MNSSIEGPIGPVHTSPAEIYRSEGLHVHVVHGIRPDGACTCGKDPCGTDNRSAGKHPTRPGWETAEPAEDIPDGYNVGLRMGVQPDGRRLLALDDDGGLAALEAEHGVLPPTFTSRSGSGGQHRIFTVPKGPVFKNLVRVGGHKVDVRCDRGQIVVAPSVHASGGQYEWIDDREPVPLPDVWIDLLAGGWAPVAASSAPKKFDCKMLDNLKNFEPQKTARKPRMRVPSEYAEQYGRMLCLTEPLAEQGEGGHGRLLAMASFLRTRLLLGREKTSDLLEEFFNPRCDPPFEVGSPEWEHKLDEAEKNLLEFKPGDLLTDAPIDMAPSSDEGDLPDDYCNRPLTLKQMREISKRNKQQRPGLFEGFPLGRGAPTLLVGPPGVGKGWIIQEIARAGASGSPLFGRFPCDRPLKILHLDYEQDLDESIRRYDFLGLPDENPITYIYVTGAKLKGALDKLTPGEVDIVIVDTLRAAAEGDENESTFADTLYYLGSLSARIGCAVLVTHHTKKGEGEGLEQIRGSGAIGGAISHALVLKGDIDAGTSTLEHVKARGGKKIETIRPRLVWTGLESVKVTALDSAAPLVPVNLLDGVQAFVLRAPGCSVRGVREHVKGDDKRISAALEILDSKQVIHNAGTVTRAQWCPVLPRPDIKGALPTVEQATWARWYCPAWWREIQDYQHYAAGKLKAVRDCKSPPDQSFPWDDQNQVV
jgi:hypothetical protein